MEQLKYIDNNGYVMPEETPLQAARGQLRYISDICERINKRIEPNVLVAVYGDSKYFIMSFYTKDTSEILFNEKVEPEDVLDTFLMKIINPIWKQ